MAIDLWAKPDIPDFEGDVFTKECLDDMIEQSQHAAVTWSGDREIVVGEFEDVRNWSTDLLCCLAPSFTVSTPLEIAEGPHDKVRFLFRHSIRVYEWNLISPRTGQQISEIQVLQMMKDNMHKKHPGPPEQEKEQPVRSTEEEFGINMDTKDYSGAPKPPDPTGPEKEKDDKDE